MFSFVRYLFIVSLALSLYSAVISSFAQEKRTLSVSSSPVEDILQLLPPEEQEEAEEYLTELLLYPLDLNKATAEELSRLPFFDSFTIRNLLLYRSRKKDGTFQSIYELKYVQGIPLSILHLLEPFLTLNPKSIKENISYKQELYFASRLEKRSNSSPFLILKYNAQKKEYHRIYFLAEKDSQEPILPLSKGGMDHLSGGFVWHTKKGTTLLFGDYRISTGLGLLMGQGRSYFSKIEVTGTNNYSTTILKPHHSVREYGFLRGAAISGSKLNLYATLFAGIENLDARIENRRLKTIYKTGLHRTLNEQIYRHTARRELLGSYLAYKGERLNLGLTSILYRHKDETGGILPPVIYPQKESLFQSAINWQYNISSKDLYSCSFWGEALLEREERKAIIGGLSCQTDLYGTFTFQGRYIGQKYSTPYAYPDTHYSSGRDEKGIRLLWRGELFPWTSSLIVLDRFRSISLPGKSGYKLTAQLLYNKHPIQSTITLRHKKREREPAVTTFRSMIKVPIHIIVPLTLQTSFNFLKTTGDSKIGYAYSVGLRYSHARIKAIDLGMQYNRLNKKQMIRSTLPFFPNIYGNRLLRGEDLRLFMGVRGQVYRNVNIYSRFQYSLRKKITPMLDVGFSVTL